jgi:hypothetical protein
MTKIENKAIYNGINTNLSQYLEDFRSPQTEQTRQIGAVLLWVYSLLFVTTMKFVYGIITNRWPFAGDAPSVHTRGAPGILSSLIPIHLPIELV